MQGFHTGLMPHQPPMLLIDDLLDSTVSGGAASLTVRDGNIFLGADGQLSNLALVEFMAQSFAATEVYQAWLAGITKPPGYLVGLERIEFHGAARVGDTLTARVASEGMIGRVAMVSGEVRRGEMLLAAGKIRLFN